MLGSGGGGTVTSITAGTGLTGGVITASGTIAIDTTVTVDKTTAQVLSSKTLTSPIINGATSSGSTALDFSGNSGTQKSTTGAQTFGGSSYSYSEGYTSSIGFSTVDFCVANGSTSGAASVTVGNTVRFLKPVTVTGIRFYWVGGVGAKTVKVTLWDSSNVSVGTANVSVNAAGAYTGTFTGVVVGSSVCYKTYTLAAWENGGSLYTYTSDTSSHPNTTIDNTAYLANPWLEVLSTGIYNAGDGQPTTELGGAGEYYALEPIFSAP
jgi:hypothetical protein